ncbi:unnamed protein product [Urochloa humidicola]
MQAIAGICWIACGLHAFVSLCQLSAVSSSHRRSICCRHQPADENGHMAYIYPMRFCRTNNSICERNNHGAVAEKDTGCMAKVISRSRCRAVGSSQNLSALEQFNMST